MGFGSYDESEQQQPDVGDEDDEAVNVHENDHEGKISVDTTASTDDLLGQLQDIKEKNDAE